MNRSMVGSEKPVSSGADQRKEKIMKYIITVETVSYIDGEEEYLIEKESVFSADSR